MRTMCGVCGTEIRSGLNECPECGTPLPNPTLKDIYILLVVLILFGVLCFAWTRSVIAVTEASRERSPFRLAATPLASSIAVRGRKQVSINVSGMFCPSCEATIRTMLEHSPGVISAEVSVERGVAIVTYDSRLTAPTKLAEVINRLGYRATLPRA